MHQSNCIRKRAAQNIFNAFDFAEHLGTPINYYCVILLKDTISQSSDTAFKILLSKFRRWLEFKRGKGLAVGNPLYVFTHENPCNNNPHVNWCLHVPKGLQIEFKDKLGKWVEDIQGRVEATTISAEPINTKNGCALRYYITKGVSPEVLTHFNQKKRHDLKGPQGTIFGQRAGFSRALGPAAIRKMSFSPKMYHRSKSMNC